MRNIKIILQKEFRRNYLLHKPRFTENNERLLENNIKVKYIFRHFAQHVFKNP